MNLFKKIFRDERGFAPIIAVIAIALVAAAVPTTIILVQQEQDNRQLASSSGLPDGTELCANTKEYYECNGNEIQVKSQKTGKTTNRPTCIAGSVCEISNAVSQCVKCVPSFSQLPPGDNVPDSDNKPACPVDLESPQYTCSTSCPDSYKRPIWACAVGDCCLVVGGNPQPSPEVTDIPPSSDSCTTIGNTNIGNEREYECLDSCGSRIPYDKTNSSCSGGKTCCRLVVSDSGGSGTGGNNPAPGNPSPSPTHPEPGVGYCANENRENDVPVKGGNCGINNATWIGPGTNSYCVQNHSGSAEYFYECPAVTTTPVPTATPTPTPYVPSPQGSICVPSQGPWQCESPNVCIVAIGEGRCCPANSEWKNNECTPIATPTPEPQAPGATDTPTPTPFNTGGTCNDYIPESNIHQVCRQGNSCLAGENINAGGKEACSSFYGGEYTCCQLPQGSGPAGSSCNKPNRECNPQNNTSAGTNDTCSGCGGYCVGNGSSGTCQSL